MYGRPTRGGLELLKGGSRLRLDRVLTMDEKKRYGETARYVLLWPHGRHQMY